MDWDILLDDVSIKDQLEGFSVNYSDGSYAKELTLSATDPSFYDQFDFSALPKLRLEVKIKETVDWISIGKFYVEQPNLSISVNKSICSGVWGRSETAMAGSPFAAKISKTWTTDTTASAIISEMADLVDLTVSFEIADYSVFSGSYSVTEVYPIDVILELVEFAGGTVRCSLDGTELIIGNTDFSPSVYDHTISDLDIISISEDIEYPEFGNRIKVCSNDSSSSLSIDLVASDDECLPADGVANSKLYAFVSNTDGPVEDGIIVSWSTEDGLTLAEETSSTGQRLISNKTHSADNYYTVTVDYPVKSVIGIWAYSDRTHEYNFWNDDLPGCMFEDNEITVYNSFNYCDQTLTITYITSGCAINTVTAGTSPLDITVTADVNGTQDDVEIKIGNACSCGSSLSAIKNTDSDICLGNTVPILISAEIMGKSATGMIAALTLTGCGELSSTKKILGEVSIINEIGYVINDIIGTSQVEASIYINDSTDPKVYLITDTDKDNDLYYNHNGKIIDLNTEIETGTEIWIDYTANGATTVSWSAEDEDEECDAEILIKIADGTEAGLSETISISASDCSDLSDESATDATSSDYSSSSDPDAFDNDGSDGGSGDFDEINACIEACEDDAGCITKCFHDSSSGLDSCAILILNRMASIENATTDTKDDIRFGLSSSTDCTQDDPYGCSCSELCESEIYEKGNTYEYGKTIHETVIETYEKDTPEYNEEYASLRATNLAECESSCEEARNGHCAVCVITGPDVLAPGESAEYICSDGYSELITMPEGACGTHEFTVGCCTFEVRSTDGQWVYYNDEATVCNTSEESPYIDGGYKQEQTGHWTQFGGTGPNNNNCPDCMDAASDSGLSSPTFCLAGEIPPFTHELCSNGWVGTVGYDGNYCVYYKLTFTTYRWECI